MDRDTHNCKYSSLEIKVIELTVGQVLCLSEKQAASGSTEMESEEW